MNSKITHICSTQSQAEYSEQFLKDAKYQNVKKEKIEDWTLLEISGNGSSKLAFAQSVPPVKFYDDRNGELWVVTADIPN